MSKENFEKKIIQIIEDDLTFDLAHYSPNMKSVLEDWQTWHPQKEFPVHVRWELVALDAMPDVSKERQLDSPYFRPKIEMVNRDTDPPSLMIYPDVQGTLTEDEAVAYYQTRFLETKNIIRKARYADLIWESLRARKSKDAYKFGIEAANIYVSQVPFCLANKAFIHLINNLHRAAEIAVLLNVPDVAVSAVKRISQSLPVLLAAQGYRYISELVETLDFLGTKFQDSVSSDIWQQVNKISIQAKASLEQQEPLNNLLLQSMMEVVILSSTRINDEKTAWSHRLQIAQIHEEEARQREKGEGATTGSMVAQKFMEDALHAYQRLVSIAPNEEERSKVIGKVEETKREVRRLIRQAEEEMHELSVKVEVPKEELEHFAQPILDANSDDVLTIFSMHPGLIPNIPKLEEQAKQMAEEAPLASLLGRTQLRDGRKVDEIPPFSDEGALKDQLGFWFQTHSMLLDYVFYRLREEGKISTETFLAHLESWEFFDERDRPFLEKAIAHYFAEDYVSMLHVLVPRIEHMLKSVFEQIGMPSVAVPNERQIREQTFGDFLCREDVRKALDEGVWHYLYFALVDESGLNLRNDVAHGWIRIESCNRTTVQICLYAILLVTRLRSELPAYR